MTHSNRHRFTIVIGTALLTTAWPVSAQQHQYKTATITLNSGARKAFQAAYLKETCDDPHYYRYVDQEVSEIEYKKRVSDPNFESPRKFLSLYRDPSLGLGSPIYFKRISFNKDGRINEIQFENHPPLDAQEYGISFPSQDWSLSCPAIYGRVAGESEDVFIRVDKIKEIVFEGPPT